MKKTKAVAISDPEKETTVTTIEFSKADDAAIKTIKARLEAQNPALKVPKRAVVSWALQRGLESLDRA